MIFLDLLAAFAVATLAGMGVGGGGLLVLYLTAIRHVGQIEAQGINLLFFLAASLGAMVIHLKKRTIRWKTVLFLSLGGVITAPLGAYLASVTDTSLLRRLFGGLLVLSGVAALWGKKPAKE